MTKLLAPLIFVFFFSHTLSFAQHPLIQSGPMLGYVDMAEACVWIQTKSKAKLALKYWTEGNEKTATTTPTFETEEQYAFTAKLIAKGLKQGTTYQYEVLINGKPFKSPHRSSFSTQPLWQWRTDPPTVRFATGSCMYINETEVDRPGKPYGGEYRILDSIATQKPDFMLWLGDNTYLREVDWNTHSGILHRNTHARSTPELQKLLAITHHYAIWDDHDFGPNNSDRSYPGKNWTEEAFNLFWANPNTNITGKGGITGFFQWADCDFYLMDDRYHRTPNRSPDPDKVMLGKDQIDWLLDAMTSSFAPFKFVAIGNQVLFPKPGDENLTGFPADYKKLLDGIAERKISGVIFLTGDRHHTELTMLPREGTYPLYDITVSPLTAGTHNPRDEGNTLQVEGTAVHERNYAMMEITGPRKDRVLKIMIYDLDNKLRWTKELKESELK